MERSLSFDVVRGYAGGPLISARAEWPLDRDPVTVLFGPSGSGKTTVLRALAGLDRPDAGFITFDGQTWFEARRRVFVRPQARGVGLLFQDHALYPHLSVAANLAFGLGAQTHAARQARVTELARWLGLTALLDRRPGGLSGGERQRVALARALAPRPRLLLLDEPLSALDGPARAVVRGELRHLLESAGVPAVVVTHDRTEALALGDRLAVIVGGAIRQVGPVDEVFSSPVDVEVARAVGTENVFRARVVRRDAGLVTLRAGEAELVAVDPGGTFEAAHACVRAEDVVVEPPERHDSSARNQLAGTVVARIEEGPLVRLTIACGVSLVALVTRASAERMRLVPGQAVCAVVKAPSINVVARD